MYWKLVLKSSRSKKTPKHVKRITFKPSVEVLESRQLLSLTSAIFAVDQGNSAITLSGDASGYPVQPQGNGSLTNNFSGSIVAGWDLGAQTINFVQAGTALNAAITGDWQPLPGGSSGNAPANYGGKITIIIFTANIAVRNLVVSGFTANPLALSGTGPSYSFPSTQTLTILSGAGDYNSVFGNGRFDLSGQSAGNQASTAGTFEDLGSGSYRVTEPISLTVQQTVGTVVATLHINGQIVANAVFPIINLSDGTSSNFNYATSAVGGGGSVATEDPAATVTRTPSANLTSMTITLLNHPDDVAEFLGFADLTGTGLTTTGYDPASGQLVISGSADPSVYQTVLRTITYENDSLTPDTSDRQIQFVVSDGINTSIVRTTTVSVSAPAGPSLPPGQGVSKQPFASDGAIVNSGSLNIGALHPEALLGTVSLDVKTAALDLATSLFTILGSRRAHLESTAFQLSGGEAIEALAMKLEIKLT